MNSKDGNGSLAMTIRQRIILLLEERPMTQREIATAIGTREREVIDHLQHVARTISPKRRLEMEPVRCLRCDFHFKKRSNYRRPNRCPVCKGEHLSSPLFFITKQG